MSMVEAKLDCACSDDPNENDTFFILDDVTPRYLKLRRVLDAVNTSLQDALHDR
ncbi:hypothetical protein ACQR1W_12975 [Bradyrhizobium sp. HKCCYLS1011]|uniref:hypothetical protein n=1 Tax=Bradyrhizobium sp. HKCCYLS1011 TaxID=3420733 RepID=UPI003EBAEEF8